MNQQPVSLCSYLTLVMLFLLMVCTFGNSLLLLQCFATIGSIQVDYKLDREAIATRQREIVTRLNSIEICVDAQLPMERQVQ
jgi:hypothetical protein